MRTSVMAMLLACATMQAAVVLDRMAVVVGQRVVKLSDVEREVRLTQFLNGQPLRGTPSLRREAAGRLVDQQLMREEIATGAYGRANDADASAMLEQIRRTRFGNSETRLQQELERYALTEDQLRGHLLWQLTVLRFIDERFRPGVLATEDELRTAYNQNPKQYGPVFETAMPKVREKVEGDRVNDQFEAWLSEERKRVRVEYREAAFTGDSR